MSVAAPIWLGLAGLVAAGVVIAHLISTSVPERDVLPTVRFVPQGAPLTVLRTRRLTDLLLLALRLLAVVLLGVALAGVHVTRDAPPRVVIADRSRAVASVAEVRDSVVALAGEGAVIVAMDAGARVVSLDSLETIPPSARGGSLSAALVSAHRAVAGSDGREITELVVVSPLVREQIDSATASLLASWQGPIRHVAIRAAGARAPAAEAVRSEGDDPVAATLGATAAARVMRTMPSAKDSAWAAEGGALVLWPATLEGSTLQRRIAPDTQRGVAAGDHVVVGNFARSHDPRHGTAVAHWLDGSPAATEMVHGAGCIREVVIPVDAAGDNALRDNFRGLARALVESCGGDPDFTKVSLADLGVIRSASSTAPRVQTPAVPQSLPTREGLWLALVALAVLIAEQLLRRRARTA